MLKLFAAVPKSFIKPKRKVDVPRTDNLIFKLHYKVRLNRFDMHNSSVIPKEVQSVKSVNRIFTSQNLKFPHFGVANFTEFSEKCINFKKPLIFQI